LSIISHVKRKENLEIVKGRERRERKGKKFMK